MKYEVKIKCVDGSIIETKLDIETIEALSKKGVEILKEKESEFNRSLKKILAYKAK